MSEYGFVERNEKKVVLTIHDNRYNLSKLLQVLVIRKLASIVDPTTDDKSTDSSCIVINCLDPCFCRTGLARDLSPGLKFFFRVFAALFARTAEEGSRLVVITASAGGRLMEGICGVGL
jgi:retinol dehydrogenase-12